jgi:sugar lactone lactonase YvrE
MTGCFFDFVLERGPNGQYLYRGLADGQERFSFQSSHGGNVTGFQRFRPGDIFVSSTVLDGTSQYPTGKGRIRQLSADLELRAEVETGRTGLISGLGIGPDGVLWVMDAQARGIDRYDPEGRKLPDLGLPKSGFGSVLFCADGTTLIADHLCGKDGPFAGTGDVYRLDAGGKVVAVYDTETNGGVSGFLGTTHMALSPDGNRLYHVSETGPVLYAHDLVANKRLGVVYTRTDPPPMLFGMAVLPNGDVVVGTGSGFRRLLPDGKPLGDWNMGGGRGWSVIKLRPDGKSLWALDFFGGTLAKVDAASGAVLRAVDMGLPKALAAVAEVPNGAGA